MNSVRIKLNNAGIQSLLKGSEVGAVVDEITDTVQRRCGDGYETANRPGRRRYIGEVIAATYTARRDNSKNNTLLKALHK